MLQNSHKRNQSGFTIIEVMIVLAIAGLIMLIVFLAVPALQRNSRNTQRKNDVSTYAAAVNEWSTNNAGKMPSATADVTTVNGLANLGTLTAPTTVPPTGAQTSTVNVDTLQLVTKAKCSTTTTGDSVAGPARSFVIRYSVEDSKGNPTKQCQEG
jgi:prepilin-type N-terminal cleavage/methylation domain-containing protein